MRKTNKFKYIKTGGLLALSLALGLGSCTKKFDSMNTDPTKIQSVTSEQYPQMFAYALMAPTLSPDNYEVGEETIASVYSQFFGQAAHSFPTDRYVVVQGWMGACWNPPYVSAVPQLKTIIEGTDANSAENAVANIWRVWIFHRVTDYFGPVPYSQAGNGQNDVEYDAQDSIYYDFFKKLDAAVTVLKSHTGENPFGAYDLVYGGKSDPVSHWIKFANTLRLRLAMRISNVDATTAKTQAEAAVAGGVMTVTDDDAYMPKSAKTYNEENALSVVAGWEDIRMSATMASIQKGYNDPRMSIFWQPASDTNLYNGMRNGLTVDEKSDSLLNTRPYTSNMGTRWCTYSGGAWHAVYTTPQDIMHAAETYFLRAEAKLNGWSVGSDDVQTLYETGIRTSMAQWGVTDQTVIDTYVNNTATPIAPGDAMNSPAVNDYPVLWSTDADMQRKQIAQQKWLALWPDGMEGWAEYRRTDLPQLYPVLHSDNPDVPVGTTIKRMPFLTAETSTNAAAVARAVTKLGGADNCATRLWWDVK